MDNNFNMQQQPMGQPMQQPMGQPMQQPMGQPMQQPMGQPMQQPMGQPMYQQPMGQQPMYNPMYQQPKKSNKGLIIGISVGAFVLVAAIVTIVLLLVLGGNKDEIIGKWETAEGNAFTFEKDNKGTVSSGGFSLPITWSRKGDELTVTMSAFGESEEMVFTIVKLNDKTLVLADEYGDEETFTKK